MIKPKIYLMPFLLIVLHFQILFSDSYIIKMKSGRTFKTAAYDDDGKVIQISTSAGNLSLSKSLIQEIVVEKGDSAPGEDDMLGQAKPDAPAASAKTPANQRGKPAQKPKEIPWKEDCTKLQFFRGQVSLYCGASGGASPEQAAKEAFGPSMKKGDVAGVARAVQTSQSCGYYQKIVAGLEAKCGK
jgi:hypothetical protein